MFLRYFADTSTDQASETALAYLRGLLKIGRVRVASMTGGLVGRWESYAALLTTPMTGTFVSVVCTAPSRWSWEHTISAPVKNGKPERIASRFDLYTHGVRNVLLTGAAPADPVQISTARKYESMVVPSEDARMQWEMNGRPGAVVIPIPVTEQDLAAFRAAVLG